jgi:hypothetical protein
MRSLGFSRRNFILAGAGLFVAVLLGLALGSGGDETPASPAVLNRIAEKNDDAATNAAARMKIESETATRAADARIEAETGESAAPAANRQAGP